MSLRRCLVVLTAPLVAACPRADPSSPVAELWSWSLEDRPTLVLLGDGTLTAGGRVVGKLDVARGTLSIPGVVQDASLDGLGQTSTEGDVQWVQVLERRLGVDASGAVFASRLPSDLGESSLAAGPWGFLRPPDTAGAARDGLLWAALAVQLPQPVVVTARLWSDDPICPVDVRVAASALGDGRLVEGAVCSATWSCDVGGVVGRWQRDGVVVSDALGGSQPLAAAVLPAATGGTDIRPVGEAEAWFTVDTGGEWHVLPSSPASRVAVGFTGSTMRADGAREPGLAATDAQAVAAWVGTRLAQGVRAAITECTLRAPPPPPPPL